MPERVSFAKIGQPFPFAFRFDPIPGVDRDDQIDEGNSIVGDVLATGRSGAARGARLWRLERERWIRKFRWDDPRCSVAAAVTLVAEVAAQQDDLGVPHDDKPRRRAGQLRYEET